MKTLSAPRSTVFFILMILIFSCVENQQDEIVHDPSRFGDTTGYAVFAAKMNEENWSIEEVEHSHWKLQNKNITTENKTDIDSAIEEFGNLARILDYVEYAKENRPMILYGKDDRRDLYELKEHLYNDEEFYQHVLHQSRSICMIFRKESEMDDYFNNPTSFARKYRPCSVSKYDNQPVPQGNDTILTGFLIGSDLVLTAGHTIDNNESTCQNFRVVFDVAYRSDDKSLSYSADNVFNVRCATAEYRMGFFYDFAILKLDSTAENDDREPIQLDLSGNFGKNDPVYAFGHPFGAPMKYVDNGRIIGDRTNMIEGWNHCDLDLFEGNSGSPIFAMKSGLAIGILSKGRTPFALPIDSDCRRYVPVSPDNYNGYCEWFYLFSSLILEINQEHPNEINAFEYCTDDSFSQ